MKTLITLIILASALSAQVTINVGTITVPTEVAVAVNTWRQSHATKTTELTAAISAVATSITVKDATIFVVGDHFMIDNEEFIVTGAGTASRGAVATVAAPHALGAPVRVLEWANNVVLLKQFIRGGIVSILRSTPSAAIATAQATIVAQQAAIANAEAGAVQ